MSLNPRDFCAVGNGITDDTVAWQNCLNRSMALGGVPIIDPGGTYVISSTLHWTITSDNVASPIIIGAGRYATIFDNRVASGPMLWLKQTSAAQFMRGGRFQDFSILTTTNPAGSVGIKMNAVYQHAFSDIRIYGLSGDLIQIDTELGDPDGCVLYTFDRCWLDTSRHGYGLNCIGAAGVENSWLVMRECFMLQNFLGGIRYQGLDGKFTNCAFTLNSPTGSGGTGGLQVAFTIGASRMVEIRGCDFENNGVCHLDIQSCDNGTVAYCEFLHALAAAPGYVIANGIKIGGSGIVNAFTANVNIIDSFVRNNTHGFVQYAIGSDALYTTIGGTRWNVFNEALPQTKFSNSGLLSRIEDLGYPWPYPTHSLKTTLSSAPATYTPDIKTYTGHEVVLTATGNYAIGIPTHAGAAFGTPFFIDILNSSGGAVVITFNGIYITQAFTQPANGDRITAQFYCNTAGSWVQLGGW